MTTSQAMGTSCPKSPYKAFGRSSRSEIMMECEAIKRAALKRESQKLGAMRSAFELSGESSRNRSTPHFRAGEQIQVFIFESVGNQRLLEICRRLHDRIARHRSHFLSDVHKSRSEESYREHRDSGRFGRTRPSTLRARHEGSSEEFSRIRQASFEARAGVETYDSRQGGN